MAIIYLWLSTLLLINNVRFALFFSDLSTLVTCTIVNVITIVYVQCVLPLLIIDTSLCLFASSLVHMLKW